MDQWVIVKTFMDKGEADVAHGLLDSAGIRTKLLSPDANGLVPALDVTQGIQLMVSPEDQEDATAMLERPFQAVSGGLQ